MADVKKPTVFTASGEIMHIAEAVSIDVNINGLVLPCLFHVTPTLSACTDIIFGVDLLQQFSCVIDLSCGTVSFCDGLITVGLQRRRVITDLCATMPYDYVLPANTEIILSLNVPFSLSATTYIAEPCRKAIDSSCIAARALVEPVNGKVNCRIANTSNRPV